MGKQSKGLFQPAETKNPFQQRRRYTGQFYTQINQLPQVANVKEQNKQPSITPKIDKCQTKNGIDNYIQGFCQSQVFKLKLLLSINTNNTPQGFNKN